MPLRPPGARSDEHLRSTCIKCARCVEVCPYGSVSLLPLLAGADFGTPVVDAEDSPCWLCMRCPEVCPTTALEPLEREQVRMGRAMVIERTCLSYNSTVCNLCFQRCPLKGTAIDLDGQLQPVIDPEACTGCGVCLHVCPNEPKSIHLDPAAP